MKPRDTVALIALVSVMFVSFVAAIWAAGTDGRHHSVLLASLITLGASLAFVGALFARAAWRDRRR